MAFDPTRLYSSLLNTGLQQKDNALYQVIRDLITQLSKVTTTSAKLSSSPGGSTITQVTQILVGLDGEDGLDGMPGPPALSSSIGKFIELEPVFIDGGSPNGFSSFGYNVLDGGTP